MGKDKSRYAKDADGQWWWRFRDGRRVRVTERACIQCGELFVAYPKKIAFCSRQCVWARRRSPEKALPTCEGCGQLFKPRGGAQRYCNHSCAATKMHALRARTTTVHDTDLVNKGNKRFSQDEQGQWWYQLPNGRTRAHIIECAFCARRALKSMFHRSRFCTSRCGLLNAQATGRVAHTGELSGNWRGGRLTVGDGYVQVYAPDHPAAKAGAKRYVLEHRMVMEEMIGRHLLPTETVHHKNGVRDDNRPDNLELWQNSHPPGQRVTEQKHCPTCTCHE